MSDPAADAAQRAHAKVADGMCTASAERQRITAAREALAPIRELHRRNRPDDGDCQGYTKQGYGYLNDWCVECSEQSGREYGTSWPCDTARLCYTTDEHCRRCGTSDNGRTM